MNTNELNKQNTSRSNAGKSSAKKTAKSAIPAPSGLETAILMVSISLGNTGFFSFVDSPASLAEPLTRYLNITPQEIGLMNSFSTAFAIIMSPVAGVLITRFGLAKMAVLFNSLILTGIFISFFGIMFRRFDVLLLGRLVYGLGGPPNVICTASASSKWFSGRFLSFSMALNLFFGQIGSSLSNFINPANVVKFRTLQVAFVYYAIVATISWTGTMIFSYLDYKNSYLLLDDIPISQAFTTPKKNRSGRKSRMSQFSNNKKDIPVADLLYRSSRKEQVVIPDLVSGNASPQKEPNFDETEDFTKFLKNSKDDSDTTARKIQSIRELQEIQTKSNNGVEYKFRLFHLRKFGFLYFCCLLIYAIVSNSYYQFSFIISDLMIHRFNYKYIDSKNFLPAIQILTAILTTLTSLVTSRIGRKLKCILIGVLLLVGSYINLLLCPSEPSPRVWASIIAIAMFLGLYQSTIWPCTALCLPSEVVSVGLGILSFSQAVFMSPLAYVFGGFIKEQRPRDYNFVLYLLIGMASLGLVVVIVAISVDSYGTRILDRPENDLEVQIARQEINIRFKRFYSFEYLMGKHYKEKGGRRTAGRETNFTETLY